MTRSERLARIQRRFGEFGQEYAALPLYGAIAQAVATDDDTAGLLLGAAPGQARPVLWLAALHDLVLRRPELPAARWYASVVGRDQVATGDPWPDVRATVLHHRDELARLMATRSTQTNEVNRSVHLARPWSAGEKTGASRPWPRSRCPRSADPPLVVAGDLVDAMPSAVASARARSGADAHVVVFSSWALTYVARDRRRDLEAALEQLSGDVAALSWLTAEPAGCAPGLEPPGPALISGGGTVLGLRRWRAGRPLPAAALGSCHPHGAWVDLSPV
jgi:hypothetical protein